MEKKVFCVKLKLEKDALDKQPFPGELGKSVFQNVSKEAWQLWLEHQKMLVNEKRLNLADYESRKYLHDQMKKFLFEGGHDKVEGYNPK